MRTCNCLVALALSFAVGLSSAATLASSDFDSGPDGWAGANGALSVKFSGCSKVTCPGVEGGALGAFGVGNRGWAYSAPAKFLGDMSAAYGGTFSFAIEAGGNDSKPLGSLPDLTLSGAGLTLVIDAGPNPLPDFGNYGFYDVGLTAGNWKVGTLSGPAATPQQLQTVLSRLTAIDIRGQFTGGASVGLLDDVVLSSADAPVVFRASPLAAPIPEPKVSDLMALGLGALGLFTRRRRVTSV